MFTRHHMVRGLLFLLAVGAQSAFAQEPAPELRLRLETAEEQPLAGTLVALIDDNDSVFVEGVTNGDGRGALIAPAGRYRVRVRRIGYGEFISQAVTMPRPAADELLLRVETERIALTAIDGTSRYRCGAIGSNQPLATVWNEITKALAASQLTKHGLTGIAIARTYKRLLDKRGDVEANDSTVGPVGNLRPFVGKDAIQLADSGYIVGNDITGWDFYGPDELVLLSSEFASTHCFRLVRDREHRGQIGVAFEPVPDRKVSDIKGVLWVDEETAELRRADFRYVNAGIIDRFKSGGFTRFRRMLSGAWLVDEWKLTMPRFKRYVGSDSELVAVGYIEAGGGIVVPSGNEPPRAMRY